MTEETGPEPDATQASMRPEPDATQAVHREPDSTQAVHREPDSTQASVRPEPEATGAYERLEPTSAQIRGTTPSASSSPTGRSTRSRRSRSGRKLRLGGGLVEVPPVPQIDPASLRRSRSAGFAAALADSADAAER